MKFLFHFINDNHYYTTVYARKLNIHILIATDQLSHSWWKGFFQYWWCWLSGPLKRPTFLSKANFFLDRFVIILFRLNFFRCTCATVHHCLFIEIHTLTMPLEPWPAPRRGAKLEEHSRWPEDSTAQPLQNKDSELTASNNSLVFLHSSHYCQHQHGKTTLWYERNVTKLKMAQFTYALVFTTVNLAMLISNQCMKKLVATTKVSQFRTS